MPTYCFSAKRTRAFPAETVERFFHMGEAPGFVRLPGGRMAFRDLKAELRGRQAAPGIWPMVSDALAVHPDQIPEARAELAAKGVKCDFNEDGCPVLENRAHRRSVLKALGYVDRDGGYSDG